MLDKKKLDKLRVTVRSHLNWLVTVIAGDDSFTKEEKAEIKKLNLPTPKESLIQRSYLLGRLKSILKKSEYKDVTPSALDKAISETKLGTLEKLVVEEARLRAGNNLKRIAADIEAGVFKKLIDTQGSLINEATIRGIVQEKTAMAALENKTWKELASSLSDALKVEYGPKVEKIARTELHSAKQKAIATAISTKVDIYGSSDGPDSNVSVVTSAGHCGDCARLYNDKDGNPKIFKLSELLSNGTNATRNHKKVKGEHPNWVPVVPPAHSNCFCALQYVPPGYIWSNRRLVLEDRDQLVKGGKDNMGNPKGPTPPPVPGNIKGVPKLGGAIPQVAGGLPPPVSSSAMPGGGGKGVVYEYWPNEGAPPEGGNWEAYEKRTGGNGWRRPAGSGAKGAAQDESGERGDGEPKKPGKGTMEAEDFLGDMRDMLSEMLITDEAKPPIDPTGKTSAQFAIAWTEQGHPDAVKLDHIKNGTIVDIRELGSTAGVTEAWQMDIAGNGSMLLKPPAFTGNHPHAEYVAAGIVLTEGAYTTPYGTGAKREVAGYNFAQAMGMQDYVPPTALRNHDNLESSVQHWSYGFEAIGDSLEKEGKILNDLYQSGETDAPEDYSELKMVMALIKEHGTPEQLESFNKKVSDGIVMSLMMNHNDQHTNNVMINKDFDLRFIDNSTAFGNGMEGVKVQLLQEVHLMGTKTGISDTMKERIKNTSLGDLKRALGPTLEDWAIGQTYMRGKYLLHLQEVDGHLDYEKFRATIGKGKSTAPIAREGFWDDYDESKPEGERSAEFNRRQKLGLLPNQMFESFAMQWIQDSMQLPNGHPDRVAAEELDYTGIFMPPGFATDPDKRRRMARADYEKTIQPGYPPSDVKTATGIIKRNPVVQETPLPGAFGKPVGELSVKPPPPPPPVGAKRFPKPVAPPAPKVPSLIPDDDDDTPAPPKRATPPPVPGKAIPQVAGGLPPPVPTPAKAPDQANAAQVARDAMKSAPAGPAAIRRARLAEAEAKAAAEAAAQAPKGRKSMFPGVQKPLVDRGTPENPVNPKSKTDLVDPADIEKQLAKGSKVSQSKTEEGSKLKKSQRLYLDLGSK